MKTKRTIAAFLTIIMLVSCLFSSVWAAETGVAGFVERLYTIALARTSDPNGKTYWIGELESHRKNGGEVAGGFFFSDELNTSGISDKEFITRLYKTFMDREPEKAGFDYWLGQISAGQTRQYVFDGFVNSAEWANICASFGIISGGSAVADQYVADFVERVYTKALDRESDSSGCEYWTNQIVSGSKTGSEVAFGFFFSDEFKKSKLPNDEYVKRLYRVFFNREFDQSGFDHWVGLLNGGTAREEIFNGFARSEEWANLCAVYGIRQGEANFEGNTIVESASGSTGSTGSTDSTGSTNTIIPPGCVEKDELNIPAINPLDYTYEIYPVVDNLNYVFYIKTENPDPYSFRLVDEGTIYSDEVRVVQPCRQGFIDVLYENINTYRVNGGYLCFNYMEDWEFFDVSDGIDGGNLKLEVRTKNSTPYSYNTLNYHNNYSSWKSTNVTVNCQPCVDLVDYLIQNYTSPSNDFFDNMYAVQNAVYKLAIYPRSVYDDQKSTGRYACLAASPYPELALNYHYDIVYERTEQSQFILYAYPFALHSQSFPGLMSMVATKLNPDVEISSTYNHAYIEVKYNGKSGQFGGAGQGGPGEIYISDITKVFTFKGDAKDYYSKPFAEWKQHYLDLCTSGNEKEQLLAESLSLNRFNGTSGAWIKVAFEGRDLTQDYYAYICGDCAKFGMSNYASSLANCWVDGRYVNDNNVYEEITFEETLKYNPSFLVKDMTYEAQEYNGTTTTHTGSVIYSYNEEHDCWVGNYTYDEAMKFNPSLILTREQVMAMDLDNNYNVEPTKGYIYNSTAAPGTPFGK